MIIIILIRTSEMLNHHLRHSVHQSADIFQVVRAFDNILLPYKFHDDILNFSRVIVLTNRQTNKRTDITETENNPPRYAIASHVVGR